jgi:hypothetical protein
MRQMMQGMMQMMRAMQNQMQLDQKSQALNDEKANGSVARLARER